jgi:hypothetical protein
MAVVDPAAIGAGMFVRSLVGSMCVAALTACPVVRPDGDDDPGDDDDDDDDDVIDTGFPAPADDVTDRIGAEETLDIGAWNIKNFPCGNDSFSTTCRANADVTPSLVADVITSMGLDLVAVEEIAGEEGFAETAQRLPHHEAIVSSDTYSDGTYQKIGFLYDTRVLEAGADSLLFQGDSNFPRPALQVSFTHKDTGLSFFAIAIHLKAGESDEDFERRGGALTRLHAYMSNLVDGDGQDNISTRRSPIRRASRTSSRCATRAATTSARRRTRSPTKCRSCRAASSSITS